MPLEVVFNPNETFGEAIKRGREEKKLSLRGLAKSINISHPYLSQLENGKTTNPSLQIVFKLAEALDMSLAYLIHLSGIEVNGFHFTLPDEMLPDFQLTNYSILKQHNTMDSFENFVESQRQLGINIDTPEKVDSYRKTYEQLLKINGIENDFRYMANLALKIKDHNNDYQEFNYEIDDSYKHSIKFEVPAYKTEIIGNSEFTNYVPPEKALQSFFDIENLLDLNSELLNFRGRKITNDEKQRIVQSIELITLLNDADNRKNKD
ncbi:helix-turn-helix domain-containing protein [Lysinibacillus capsici]|uniref:helix-turn-helix domain-containing protein n=1 Tax=Lysinibacillus capsici TaxID=2115968 RepID=UPI0032DF52DD